MSKHIVILQRRGAGIKTWRERLILPCWGEGGDKKLHLSLALGWELEEKIIFWVKKRVGKRHSGRGRSLNQGSEMAQRKVHAQLKREEKLLQMDCEGPGIPEAPNAKGV